MCAEQARRAGAQTLRVTSQKLAGMVGRNLKNLYNGANLLRSLSWNTWGSTMSLINRHLSFSDQRTNNLRSPTILLLYILIPELSMISLQCNFSTKTFRSILNRLTKKLKTTVIWVLGTICKDAENCISGFQ